MALNPVAYTEKVVSSFLRYQLTAYRFADENLYAQMRTLLSLEATRRTPLLKGPYISLSKSFREGASVDALVGDGVLHPHMARLIPYPHVYGHQECAIRAVAGGRTTLVSTGTGSGKTECFLYPVISRCLQLRDEAKAAGITAVFIYPMNALAEDQLGRLRGLLAGTGITFGMYVGKTPERRADVPGQRLPEGASNADYQAAFEQTQRERRGTAVHPPEERCSREEMRAEGEQPHILITNVKQLELLLTRHRDVELFDNANLEFIVVDEAHTFAGAAGAETACLIRRLRSFCGRSPEDTVCVATSATLADPEFGLDAGRVFASRFFGVDGDAVELVGEEYAPDTWQQERLPDAPLPGDPAGHLQSLLTADDAGDDAGAAVAAVFEAMTGSRLDAEDWQSDLYAALASRETVYQIAQALDRVRALPDLLADLTDRLGREITEEEVLAWLTLGAASRLDGRPLLRPVVHTFVRGVGGAVVTFPADEEQPRLWLSAEDERTDEGEARLVRLPVLACNTCGQHYFEHHLEDFEYAEGAPGGGRAAGNSHVWQALDPARGGRRVLFVDHAIGAEDEDTQPANTTELFMCRACGAVHPAGRKTCDGCGETGLLVRLLAVAQRRDHPGQLTRCVSCGSTGRARGSGYREPARPVRAVTVADVHVLAQDMVHHAERKRLLVFADNRQDAAFQAGWMRDHARRFRLRALMNERIAQGSVSVGDLTAWLDDMLEQDEELSRVLIPEVWNVARREAEGVRHAEERKRFLRIQVLREITTGVKQRTGLEPWGRLRVHYAGVDAEAPFIVQQAAAMGVPAAELASGIGVLLDIMRRRTLVVYDAEGKIFSRFWHDGDYEISRGYLPRMPGVPKGLKLCRAVDDDQNRVYQWISRGGHLTSAREIVRSWGVSAEDTDAFLEALWNFLTEGIGVLVPVTLRGSQGRAVPNCSGVFQIDADKLRLTHIRELYRCRKCRRTQVRRTPLDACPGWHCDGQLEFVPEDRDSYDLTLLDAGVAMIRPREHSAQVPVEDRDYIERMFKGDAEIINTLVCTPTLELGVDIGQLDTVLLRNVPPLPANYWQRVGRAGRRHRMAVNVAYARPLSHDQIYFTDPLRMLEGRVEPPRFNLRNALMVKKHVHATLLTRLFQLAREHSGLGEYDRDEIASALEHSFPTRIGDYLFDAQGNVRGADYDLTPFVTVVSKHHVDLADSVRHAFAQGWPTDDAEAVEDSVLTMYVGNAPASLAEVIIRFRRRLVWALDQMRRLDSVRRLQGTLNPADEALYSRCDRLVKRLKGMQFRRRQQAEGYDDTNTYAALAAEGFLPGYGLEIGAIVATAQVPRYLPDARDFDLRRATTVGVREYVPGALIYANGHRFTPRYFHLEPEEPLHFQVDTDTGAIVETGVDAPPYVEDGAARTAGLGESQLRAVAMCDVDLPHVSHISDDEEFRFQMGVSVLGYEQGRWSGGQAYQWGSREVQLRRGVHLRLVNVGVTRRLDGDNPELGYPVCLVCGQSRSPFASERELQNFAQDHMQRCGREIEPVGFYTDVIADALSLSDCANLEEAYSVLEALRTGAAQVLEMETEDLDILAIAQAGREEVDGLLFDPMPGGSGLLDQICERFDEVVRAASELTRHCPSDCDRACVDCLYRFRNAFFHRHLDRHLAAERFEQWGDSLATSHPIPPRMPDVRSPAVGGGMPVNEAEDNLRNLLDRAGFPAGQWQHNILLGRPLGSTTPDCYYPDDDREEPGICIYLDGLSGHLHGNPATAEKDREIREELRSRGYQVFEIAATDLHDRDRMARHFYRIAQILLGREQARNLRDVPDWFDGINREVAVTDTIVPFREIQNVEPGQQFSECVPLVSLKAAAGGFGETMEVESVSWVAPTTNRSLGPGMFVAQVVGQSMEPRIPNGAYCLFQADVAGSRTGRILLVQHRDIHDPETGGSYTVKKFDSRQVHGKDGADRTGKILLKPENPDFEPIVLENVPEEDVAVIAEMLEVLLGVCRI